jgi:cob(I)alamin adenosyltransferase
MENRDYAAAELATNDLREEHDQRLENFAWILQMVDYCGAELATPESATAEADVTGKDTSELEEKMQSLEAVIKSLKEVQDGYRDM